MASAAQELSAQHLTPDPTHPSVVAALREYLADSALVIAQVFAAEIDRIAGAIVPAPISPHGRLCAGPFGQLHAVVLVGYHERGFLYLDPYYEPAGQPFFMSAQDFVKAFQGEIVLA